MADVVGTAFVRIKALTNDLAKDIEKSVKKGFKDADLEKPAEDAGERSGEAYGDGFSDSANKQIKKNSKDIIPSDSLLGGLDNALRDVRERFQQLDFDDAIGGIEERFDQLSFDFPDVDVEPVEEAFEEIRQQQQRLANDIDNGALGKSLDKLSARFKKLGSSSGVSLGPLKKILLGVGGAVVAALPFIQDAGAAILAYATGLVAQIGFLTTAVGGLGIAAAAAIGSAAVVALPLILAFKAETKFLEGFKESIAGTADEFLAIGIATQATLLPGLNRAFIILTDLIPMFSEFGLFVGNAVGTFAEFAANILTSNEAQGRFSAILQSSLRILDVLFPTLINIGNILSGIWVAAIPASERFVQTIGRLVDRWSAMVTEGLRTGELVDTFDTWYDRAELLGSAIGNLAGALFDILSIGADSSDNVFVRFDEWAERYRAFTESEAGQNKIRLIFENALDVMREVNGLAADLFDGIFGRLGEVGGVDSLVGALQRVREVLPGLQEGFQDFLDSVREIVLIVGENIFDKMQKAAEELAEPLGRLVFQILDLLEVMDESGAFELFIDLMKILTDTLSTLLAIPGFGQFIAYFIAFNSALKVSAVVLGPFVKGFGSLIGLISTLVKFKAGFALAETATGLTKLAAGFRAVSTANAAKAASDVAAGTAATVGNAGKLSGALATGLTALSGMGAALPIVGTALAIGGAAFFIHQQNVQKWRQEIRQATEDIGLLNDGLNITAEGIANYIKQSSRFESNDQLDDLARLGFTVESLGTQIAGATLSLTEFVDAAIRSEDIGVTLIGPDVTEDISNQVSSLKDLQKQYNLTDKQVRELADGESVRSGNNNIVLNQNTSLIRSFKELNKVIGAAAIESVDAFATNTQNIRLLGAAALAQINSDVKAAGDDGAAQVMVDAQNKLASAAVRNSIGIKLVTKATREQITEQARLADGTIDVVKQNELLYQSQQRTAEQLRTNLALFGSSDFKRNFRDARNAVVDFSDEMVTASTNARNFGVDIGTLNVDQITDVFPELAQSTQELFDQLGSLPEAEFNAAATALGTDADTLRGAIDGASEALVNLQEAALQSLPSVAELLNDATGTREDGSQFFDSKGFLKGVQDRTAQTKAFGDNIKLIAENVGQEAARLAAQQGPEAAKNLATMAVGKDKEGLNTALKAMEDAEVALSAQIKDVLGPGIAAEYASAAGLISDDFNSSLIDGLSDPAVLKKIQKAGTDVLNQLERTFSGYFTFENGVLKFVSTGEKAQKNSTNAGIGFRRFSAGGFVDSSGFFGGGPMGTDTIPAMLTPGEFVLRRAIAQAIPASVLNSLNAGDPRIMGLLTSLSANRAGGSAALAVSGAAAPGATGAGGSFVIQQMNIEAPEPLQSARMVSDRLKILHTQLTRR